MSESADKQIPKQLAPYVFKKGQSGNPKGRPLGKTLKEWAREKIIEMNEEDRIEFLKRLPAEIIWRMAEGNPHSTEDVRHTVAPTPIMQLENVKVDTPQLATHDSEPSAMGHASSETPPA